MNNIFYIPKTLLLIKIIFPKRKYKMINNHIQTNQLLSVDDFNVPKESLAQLASFDSTNANMCENINKNLFIICMLIE